MSFLCKIAFEYRNDDRWIAIASDGVLRRHNFGSSLSTLTKNRESEKATTVADTSLTKGLMRNTMAVRVRYNARYISLLSSAKLQREMKRFEREQLLLIFKVYISNSMLCFRFRFDMVLTRTNKRNDFIVSRDSCTVGKI